VSELVVKLFGRFHVESEGQSIEGLDAKKVQELFSYLLINRDHAHPRETLAGVLWDAQTTAQSKKYLRQALWQLQNSLQEVEDLSAEPILLVTPEWVRINPNANIHLDIGEFEKAFISTRRKRGRELIPEQIRALETASELYKGDLLLGWYQDWCIFERERLQSIYIALLDKLMGYFEAHGYYEDGILYGSRILAFDRARERTHRSLIRLYYLADDRTGALRQYQRCVLALAEELGVNPARRTDELHELVVEDRPISEFILDNYSLELKGGISETSQALPKTATHLKRIQEMLITIQQSIHKDLETIENISKSDSSL
jgi:DNA-binding SARP family transcriptional activator